MGKGQTNIDRKTGIRYGVIQAIDVQRAWSDSSDCSGFLDDGEYLAEQGADDTDIFIFKSPYFTRVAFCSVAFCSPCAPGAGCLHKEGVRIYCFGHDYFEEEAAPYPVYSVKTGKLIPPPKKGEKANGKS